MTAHSSNLAGVLSAARGRLMAVRVGPSVLWWITAAALAAACAALLLRWMGFATWWLAAWPAVGALVALVRGWASRMTLLDAAVAVDHTHGFKDTLSTAWSADRGALVDEAFAALHREQTGQCLRRIDLSRLGGMPAGSTIAASIGSIVLLAVALALPWPAARDGLAVRESSERIAAREREQSERDFTETAPVDELPQLADRIEQLAQDGDLAEAEKAVEELERRMEELARRRRERAGVRAPL